MIDNTRMPKFEDELEILRTFTNLKIVFLPDFISSGINWEDKFGQMKNLLKFFKSIKHKYGEKTIAGYLKFFEGVRFFELRDAKKALKLLQKAGKSFPSPGFEFEKFKINLILGIIHSSFNEDKKALSYYFKALNEIISFDRKKYRDFREAEEMKHLLAKLFPHRQQLKDDEQLLFLIDEKISFLNKEVNYIELLKLYMEKVSILLHRTQYELALDLIIENKLPMASFLDNLQPIYNRFIRIPDLKLANFFIKLFSFQTANTEVLAAFNEWKQGVIPKISDLVIDNPIEITQLENSDAIFDFIFKDKLAVQKFMISISQMTIDLIERPRDKKIMAFLLRLNETLLDRGLKSESQKINSWIQSTLQLRKVNDKSSRAYANVILSILKETQGDFAPIPLIRSYHNRAWDGLGYRANARECNIYSNYIGDISIVAHELPDGPTKVLILREVDDMTEKVASGYKSILLQRMRQQDLDDALSRGPVYIANRLFNGVEYDNPIPLARGIEELFIQWKYLPNLEKIKYVSYDYRQKQFIKPIYWFLAFRDVYFVLLNATESRLWKSEDHKKFILRTLVRGNINFLFNFNRCIRDDPQIPRIDLRSTVVEFLRKADERHQFMDEELREIVNTSQWGRGHSGSILSEVIEFKNYCIYCNYNMPKGTKICPNCNKEVGTSPLEAPDIDLGAMGAFFSGSSTPAPSSTPSSTPTTARAPAPSPIQTPTATPRRPIKSGKCEFCGKQDMENVKNCGDVKLREISTSSYVDGVIHKDDLMITDLRLPRGCGREFCKDCRAKTISVALDREFPNADPEFLNTGLTVARQLFGAYYCKQCHNDENLIPGKEIAQRTRPNQTAIMLG